MKKLTALTIIAIVWTGLMLGVGWGVSECTAAPANIAGKWLGTIKVPGLVLRMAFEISKAKEGRYTAVLHNIDQGNMNIPMNSVTVNGDSLRLEMKSVFSYEGNFQPDGNTITGNWVQGGLTPLDLKRVDKIPELNRPQTPKKPYPYIEEEVVFQNPSANIRIAGTLTIPKKKGPFPAVLLIGGSGPSDRDYGALGHKMFLVVADHLTRQGITVLRVDDRGVGKSTGTFSGSVMDDYVSDALAGVEYLKSRPEVDKKRIGLVGHSDGGSVAPVVAVQSSDVSFIVILGAVGISFCDLLVLQDGTEAKASGKTDAEVELIRGFSRRFYTIALQPKTASEIERETLALYARLTDAEKKALEAVGWPNLWGTLNLSWANTPAGRKQLEFDIRPTLRKLRCPVLALNGSKDCQVPPRENLAGIEKELKAGGNRNFTVREIPGLNHCFQTCDTGAVSEYVKIEETISPLVLQTVAGWIGEQTGIKTAK
ncbi:MAG: alpha/beta hydrolase family protein [Candidatus Latescibacterota bacterium]